MKFQSPSRLLAKWLLLASFLSFGFSAVQAEPTMKEVYATAQAGKLEEAQIMIQQVLVSHPNSPKALFVQSELYARQGNMARAREALADAEKLAPGLPFAKAEAVQTLRAQIAAKSSPPVARTAAPTPHMAAPVATAPASSSSWGLPILLGVGVVIAGFFIFRKKTPQVMAQQPIYTNQNGMAGPQSFGMAGNAGTMQSPSGQTGYAQPGGYPQPGAGQTAGSGLGGRIMGGVATGLAVGAGVMAAEAIGRNLMGNHNTPAAPANSLDRNDYQPIATNPEMGGENFGINDTSSWDDGGSADAGGGDWDN